MASQQTIDSSADSYRTQRKRSTFCNGCSCCLVSCAAGRPVRIRLMSGAVRRRSAVLCSAEARSSVRSCVGRRRRRLRRLRAQVRVGLERSASHKHTRREEISGPNCSRGHSLRAGLESTVQYEATNKSIVLYSTVSNRIECNGMESRRGEWICRETRRTRCAPVHLRVHYSNWIRRPVRTNSSLEALRGREPRARESRRGEWNAVERAGCGAEALRSAGVVLVLSLGEPNCNVR